MSDAAVEFYKRTVATQQFAVIDTSSSGDNTIVTVASGQKCVVLSIFLIVGADNTIIWKSGSTTILGAAALKEGGGYHVESDFGITETADGADLIVNLSGATQVGGGVTFVLV